MAIDQDRERKAEEIFQQTLDLAPEQREEFLHRCCEDPEVLRRVETLLRHYEKAGQFLGTVDPTAPPDQAPMPQQPSHQSSIGGTIGPYKLLRVIGEGGMGVVYEAEEDRPRRRVALKVIRPGFTSAAMLRRFEYEADVLARLEHPGIARIYRAGVADTGLGPQPYFAMELVQGKRLHEFVREAVLSTNQRLKLLIEICNAVHHAHTKGVIHRDLKPSNILVSGEGQPKILDFGVARAIDSDIQATTLHTESGQLIGTLPYMAPEQAAGKVRELDTSSDVYALGVIAYELLSGKMPYSLEGCALHEAVRVICEQEPSRLSSINRSLRGDVETIVQKAMEKDKTRRYATAGELAADVKRYLDYEPITARPPGRWYQVAKFAKRNRAVVGGAVFSIMLLLGGLTGTTIGLIGQARARADAEAKTATLATLNEFLTDDLLGYANPALHKGSEITVRQALDNAAEQVGRKFSDSPLLEATTRNALANLYFSVGRYDLALVQAQRALETRTRLLGESHRDSLESLQLVAAMLLQQRQLSDAEAIYRNTVPRARAILKDKDPLTLEMIGGLAVALREQGKVAEAEPLFRELLERCTAPKVLTRPVYS